MRRFRSDFRALAVCLGALVALGGCGHSRAVDKTSQGLGGAVLTPVNDLNLTRNEIPPALKAIDRVYSETPPADCAAIAADVAALDAVLGADEDLPQEERDRATRASDAASDATLDAVAGATGGVVPFRGLVRQVTGANAYEKRLKAAFLKGYQRRAYLKGYGQALACPPPAAPRPLPPPDPVDATGDEDSPASLSNPQP